MPIESSQWNRWASTPSSRLPALNRLKPKHSPIDSEHNLLLNPTKSKNIKVLYKTQISVLLANEIPLLANFRCLVLLLEMHFVSKRSPNNAFLSETLSVRPFEPLFSFLSTNRGERQLTDNFREFLNSSSLAKLTAFQMNSIDNYQKLLVK